MPTFVCWSRTPPRRPPSLPPSLSICEKFLTSSIFTASLSLSFSPSLLSRIVKLELWRIRWYLSRVLVVPSPSPFTSSQPTEPISHRTDGRTDAEGGDRLAL